MLVAEIRAPVHPALAVRAAAAWRDPAAGHGARGAGAGPAAALARARHQDPAPLPRLPPHAAPAGELPGSEARRDAHPGRVEGVQAEAGRSV